MTATAQAGEDEASIRRWWRVVGGLSMNLALGSLYGWSVLVAPLEKVFGWKRTDTSRVFTWAVVAFAISFILAGRIQDKFGPFWVSSPVWQRYKYLRKRGSMKLNSRIIPEIIGRNINRRHFLAWTASAAIVGATLRTSSAESNADRIVVLTFDDAVKTQRTLVGPLLKELGFGASFFVCHRWMVLGSDPYVDPKQYMTWQDIAELHQMGFEIGNHSWTHPTFSVPKDAARLPAELALVERELHKVGVPRPTSFAWCGDHFSTEAVQNLGDLGYKLARRGTEPEVPFGDTTETGPTYDPKKQHPLLIPTTGNDYPGWTLENFRKVAECARPGQIVVYQFHGVPDPHPWVNCPPERFREYMEYLKKEGYRVVALRDVEQYMPKTIPNDPVLKIPYIGSPTPKMVLPTEMEATRADLGYWLKDMIHYHHYSWEEVEKVTGLTKVALKSRAQAMGLDASSPAEPYKNEEAIRAIPYPGGRHPRIGFLEGAICPMRGTKASVFLPWDPASYVVIDLPEAVFTNLGLTFLAHTDVSTIWDDQNIWLDNIDWNRTPAGTLSSNRVLPNKIAFGGSVQQSAGGVDLELWLRNDTSETLTGLRSQICVMFKGAPDFNSQTNDNKIFKGSVSAVKSVKRGRWILVAWDRCDRAWGNALVPCMHADPVLADCLPGQTVRVLGRLWFYEGSDIDGEIGRAQQTFTALTVTG